MARIYFDSNVFSNLRNEIEPKYIALKEAIEKWKENFSFFFSHAHIRDKINDSSNFKFEDFEYMKTLVGNNYLSYHALEKRTSSYLATPSEVFQDNDSLMNVDIVMGGVYKELRALIETGGRDLAYPIGDKVYILNELFNNGTVSDKFVEFIKDTLYNEDKKNIAYYDFYLQSYSILDILGFSKDKLTKKNSYNNIFNDSLHSYYARYCDYLVTGDDGLKKKSSILYNKYEVATKILTVDEFLEVIDSLGAKTDIDVMQFFQKLGNDLLSGTLISNFSEENVTTYLIKPIGRYFNFFDSLMVLKTKNEGVFIFLTKEKAHYMSDPNYKECEMITNRVVEVFFKDLLGRERFEWDLEKEEMVKGKWPGRYWEIGDTRVYLQINEGTKDFCVQIGPLSRWHFVSHFKDEHITEL